jgi:hypothetical protein
LGDKALSDYSLSFTGSALRKAESVILARHYNATGDWVETRKAAIAEDLLMIPSVSSRKRVTSELIKRLKTLSAQENSYLIHAAPTEQSLILWVAVCRTYQFVDDFSRKVLGDRFKGLFGAITPGVFEGFYDEQVAIHPELRQISEQTHARLRSQLLQMIREAGLTDDEGIVQRAFISPELQSLLDEAGWGEAAIFPKVG